MSKDLELFHYGIKGMKWGVKRPEGSDGRVSSFVKKKKAQAKTEIKERISRPTTDDAKNAKAARSRAKKHGTDALTNKKLQEAVTRMNLEQQYSALVENQKATSRRSGAQRYVADILKEAGSETLKSGLTWAATEGAKYAFNQKFNPSNNRGANDTVRQITQQGRKLLER